MNFELYIAKRIHFSRQGKKNVSRPAVKVAVLGIALGLAVMIIAVSIVIGFKQEIRNKVIAFGSHIQVSNYDSNQTYETKPIKVTPNLFKDLYKIDQVRHVQPFCTKPGIIKTTDDVQGIVLKGVDKNFDWSFYRPNIVAGDSLTIDGEWPCRYALISQYLSKLLKLKVGDPFFTYFVEGEDIRARKFTVGGIYCTNFEEYDKQFIIVDMMQIQQLNGWEPDQCSGLEILVKDYAQLDKTCDRVYYKTANRIQQDGTAYLPRTIEDLNPQVFSWLRMLDMNVWIILLLMIVVAGFNMISGLLILILERTNMIGILKAMGASNWKVRKIFLYHSFFLVGKGMLWGNAIGISLILLQHFTHLMPLDASVYYVSYVPTTINIVYLLLLNFGTFVCSVLMLLFPSYVISKISPAKSIKFD